MLHHVGAYESQSCSNLATSSLLDSSNYCRPIFFYQSSYDLHIQISCPSQNRYPKDLGQALFALNT
jgi:hypothetical protein